MHPQWFSSRPIPIRQEVLKLPTRCRQVLNPDLEDRMRKFYEQETDHNYSTLDDAAYGFLEAKLRPHGIPSPAYYGYFLGNDLSGCPSENPPLYLRTVGFLPPPQVKMEGILLDLRGYTHSIDHSLDRIRFFVEGGLAVFTFDKIDHGLSSRWDPTKSHLHSADLYAHHTRQFIELVHAFRQENVRLRDKPVFALASSVAASHLLGVPRLFGEALKMDSVAYDCPYWNAKMSIVPPRIRRLQQEVRTRFGRVPEMALNQPRLRFYPPTLPTPHVPPMTEQRHAYLQRLHSAGLTLVAHPPADDTQTLLERNEHWLFEANANGLRRIREEALRLLPSKQMLALCPDDPITDAPASLAIFSSMIDTGLTDVALRLVSHHALFTVGGDDRFVSDLISFYLGRLIPGQHNESLFVGPDAVQAEDTRRRKHRRQSIDP